MKCPEGIRFTKEHEWVILEENIATIGISSFAQESLGDITYVQLPNENEELNKDDTFGVVESVKAVSDMYCPVEGRVIEVNPLLAETPSLVNQDPYGDGWFIKLEVKDENLSVVNGLMTESDYKTYIEETI